MRELRIFLHSVLFSFTCCFLCLSRTSFFTSPSSLSSVFFLLSSRFWPFLMKRLFVWLIKSSVTLSLSQPSPNSYICLIMKTTTILRVFYLSFNLMWWLLCVWDALRGLLLNWIYFNVIYYHWHTSLSLFLYQAKYFFIRYYSVTLKWPKVDENH